MDVRRETRFRVASEASTESGEEEIDVFFPRRPAGEEGFVGPKKRRVFLLSSSSKPSASKPPPFKALDVVVCVVVVVASRVIFLSFSSEGKENSKIFLRVRAFPKNGANETLKNNVAVLLSLFTHAFLLFT